MKKSTLVAAAVLLLALVAAAPGLAVPANDVLIAGRLKADGLLRAYANGATARAAVRALGARGTAYPVKAPAGASATGGALRRFLAGRTTGRGAAAPYAAQALVLLVEFGSAAWPSGDPGGHQLDGPLHGAIPAPAAGDNATFWPADVSAAHYDGLLFGDSYPVNGAPSGTVPGTSRSTMHDYYLEQSHGAYTVAGDVAGWVQLPQPESWYGADSSPWYATDDLNGPVWRVARDALLAFAAANPGFDWSRYDRENPWGITGRRFDQPDGYVDHLILVHAGSDESAGGGAQGADAIWAHSWGIYEREAGGPGDGPGLLIPGTQGQGPGGRGIWACKYTMGPEDGGAGVFCHEYGHDLGLPDEYDRTSATGDASNGFWTLMAAGSWLGRQWGLGSEPAAMDVWDKAALGFVTPKVVRRGQATTVRLQPAATGTADAVAVRVELPPLRSRVRLSGADGADEWYSGSGDGLRATLTSRTPLAVPAGGALTFRTWYEIEGGYDSGLVQVSADRGETWTTLRRFTGSDASRWRSAVSAPLAGFEGRRVLVRFVYATDSTLHGAGWEVTAVKLAGKRLTVSGFVSRGWTRVDGSTAKLTERSYLAEYRTRSGADASLASCYQLSDDSGTLADWFSYDPGLVLLYRDARYADNDVSDHIGHGGWMVVDARPQPDRVSYGGRYGFWRPRIQVRDAAFSPLPTAAQTIYFRDYEQDVGVGQQTAPGRPARRRFDDARQYWYADTPEAGVVVPTLGVRLQVKAMTAGTLTLRIDDRK